MRSATSSTSSNRSQSILSPPFSSPLRTGSITSAVFNLVTTMIGGGVLSLPYAFSQAGLITGIIMVVGVGAVADFTVYSLVECSRRSHSSSFEGISLSTLGPLGYKLTLTCVILTTFLAVIGYAVLLRDLITPIWNRFVPTLIVSGNVLMVVTAGSVTPLMFMRSLTALKPMGVVGCCTIFTLAACIFYRIVTCGNQGAANIDEDDDFVIPDPAPDVESYFSYVSLFGTSSGILNSLPIFICTFVCHFNVLPVHDELTRPTRLRLRRLIHTTFIVTVAFYGFVGGAGMGVGRCPYYPKDEDKGGQVKGNVLLNFPSTDNLMSFGRGCLGITITLAFPLLVIPCRDMILRIIEESTGGEKGGNEVGGEGRVYDFGKLVNKDLGMIGGGESLGENGGLEEPLLVSQAPGERSTDDGDRMYRNILGDGGFVGDEDGGSEKGKVRKIIVTLMVFWGGLTGATCVDNIEVVWDVLGSSISILVAFLIPCACYLIVSKGKDTFSPDNVGGGLEAGQKTLNTNYTDQDDFQELDSATGEGVAVAMGRESTTENNNNNIIGTYPSPQSTASSGKRSRRSKEAALHVKRRRAVAWFIMVTFTALMFICTGNAILHLVNNNS